MEKLNKKIDLISDLNLEETILITGGSEWTDWSWRKIGAGLHHVYNAITNPNTPEHIW